MNEIEEVAAYRARMGLVNWLCLGVVVIGASSFAFAWAQSIVDWFQMAGVR